MRLGGPVINHTTTPEGWVKELKNLGYRSAYCPLNNDATDSVIASYKKAAEDADIIIAEVGCWSNPMSKNKEIRDTAIEYCKKQLALADKLGVICCVNISGSRGEIWDGPDKDNLIEETFDLVVKTVQEIIDAVNPKHTFYTLEPMPWMYPDTADSFLKLIKAVNRKQFAVHLDIVNVINSPSKFFNNAEIIKEWFEKLGPYIKSCHAKDITLSSKLTVHLDEAIPGTGSLSFDTLLTELNKLDPDTPIMLEHLTTEEEYNLANSNIREIAKKLNISL